MTHLREIILSLSDTGLDFDGHTEFSNLNPDQRLSWLDQANAAYLELHALVRPALLVAEESSEYKTCCE